MPKQYLDGKLMFVEMVTEESWTTGMPLLIVKLKDRHNKVYSWAPKWADLVSLVERAKVIESGNKSKGNGSWLLDYEIGRCTKQNSK